MDTVGNIVDRYKKRVSNSTSSPISTFTPKKTSTLTADESRPDTCPDCGGLGFLRADVPVGHFQFGKPVPCQNPCHNPERLSRAAAVSGLAPADMSRRLADIGSNDGNMEMLEAARQIITNPYGWLYIWGGPGNAKSETLIAIVNEINTAGHGPAMYTNLASLINWMRDSFKERKLQEKDPDAELGYTKRFERILGIKVLAIDEMDKARNTEFADEFRFHFLDERYRQAIRGETVTIFAGNPNPNTLPLPLYDRIRDGRFRIVENRAASARSGMRR